MARLANVLKVAQPDHAGTTSLRFPERRERLYSAESEALSIREFLSLRKCRLHTLIATKNSLIGKVAPSSQHLFLDLDILHHGPACVDQLRRDNQTGLADKLEQFLAQKETRVPELLWHALLGSNENAQLWMVRKIDRYPQQVPGDIEESLLGLSRFAAAVLAGKYNFSPANNDDIETLLSALRHGDAGLLLHELSQLDRQLQNANLVVQQRLSRPLCLQPQPTPQARYFENVVRQQFIERVQRHAVALQQRYTQLLPAYRELESLLQAYEPPVYRQWRGQRDTQLDAGLSASKKHAQQLQRLYQQCGLRPGAR